MPVKNGERHITEALESIRLNCSVDDELIVIDDGSDDRTQAIVSAFDADFDIHILSGHSFGPAKARNQGLLKAKGKYITFLDHDDHWPEGRVKTHLALLGTNRAADIAMGKTQYFAEPLTGGDRAIRFNHEIVQFATALYHVHLGASTFRSSVFKTVGLFDEHLRFSEDHDLFLRIREAGFCIEPLQDIGLYYRQHETNMTRNKEMQEMQIFTVLQKSLRRRREKNARLSTFPRNL